MKITVDVAASDYGHTAVTISTGEKVVQLLKGIFGMQANGNLVVNYTQAFVHNCLLFVPMGYWVLLWMIEGDRSSSTVNTATPDSRVKEVYASALVPQVSKKSLASCGNLYGGQCGHRTAPRVDGTRYG